MPIVQGNPISILVLKGEKGDSGEGTGNISFANITGNPEDNSALSEVLSNKLEAGDLSTVPHKQDVKDLTNNNKMDFTEIFKKLGIGIEEEILTMWFKACYKKGDTLIWYNLNDPNKIFPYSLGEWELTSRGRSIVGRDPENLKYRTPGGKVGTSSVDMPKHKHKTCVWNKTINNISWDERSLVVGNGVEIVMSEVYSVPSLTKVGTATDKAFFYATIGSVGPAGGATSKLVIGEKDAPFDENVKIPIEPLGEVCSIWKLLRMWTK